MKKTALLSITVGATLLLLLGGCGSKEEVKGTVEAGTVSSTTEKLKDGEKVDVESVSLKDDGSFKEIIKGDNDPKVKLEAKYDTDWQDKSWENVDFKIDKVKIVEVDKYKDKENNEYKGLMSMDFTLKNDGKEDVSIHPSDAVLVLKDGTEITGKHFRDYWEDVFAKDKQKDGHVYFAFDKLDQADQVKEIKLTFDGHKKGDDSDKVEHTYDVKLPLELQK
ncbi:hypothetical protein [Vagococcus bubulae]|uniref:DUF4352 domain-containing protein n=1 Tax=Vagococcus bubulae TaxID=1977868 RepID=A0A429ZKL7_9ENTE|nr:hypothetical protein [Vagococcus bubulae]RST94228.1 hypothetical protein CBF36_06225 [Vagococcus bubulae]